MNTMTPKNILIGVRDLLAEPSHWMKESLAKNAEDEKVNPSSNEAVCWCLMGAFLRVGGHAKIPDYSSSLKTFISCVSDSENFSMLGWNDNPKRTHAEVIEALDKAIEKC